MKRQPSNRRSRIDEASVRYLIVNGDDFGLTDGVNRGILETHRRGVLTSTSLMVNRRAAPAAAAAARELPSLSVGLHLEIDGPVADPRAGIAQQLHRFELLMGAGPTHLDSHHDAHRDPHVLPHVLACAERLGIPVRAHSQVVCFGNFYGQWAGECHPEQVGVDSLLALLQQHVQRGVTELICHPGYVDADLDSSYAAVREKEVASLCDPRVRDALSEHGIRLIGFSDLPVVLASEAAAREEGWRR